MSKEGFARAVRTTLGGQDARERLSAGDFSDVDGLDLDEHERSLLRAAARELVDASEVEGFTDYPGVYLEELFGPGPTAIPGVSAGTDARFTSVQNALDYLRG